MKAEFLTPLVIRMLPESSPQSWQLVEDLVYYSAIMNKTVTVPAGFITDLVSFEPLKGVGQRPAVIHDYYCSKEEIPRLYADRVFHEALHSVGVNALLADEMFLAVRAYAIAKGK